jgi:hypothetical protein
MHIHTNISNSHEHSLYGKTVYNTNVIQLNFTVWHKYISLKQILTLTESGSSECSVPTTYHFVQVL